jgi:hypothetical protein
MDEQKKQPKVFISYSWTSQQHQDLIREWAENLLHDGVEIVMDIFDLKEGQDKYTFMERMVTDESISHVLIFCDSEYSKKADLRKAGVGTESQIISEEVYKKVDQSKFIPIACEFTENGEPYLPTFLKNRIWIDFSSLESVNSNWEQLIRTLYGKPLHTKPELGNPPSFISEETIIPSSPVVIKFNLLKQAILRDQRGLDIYRNDFFKACLDYIDKFRYRNDPQVESFDEKIVEDCSKLIIIRNLLTDWVMLESTILSTESFCKSLLPFLEKLYEMKTKPQEVTTWSDVWYESPSLFVYETFLYIVAGLLKTNSFEPLHEIFTSHYLVPSHIRDGRNNFYSFENFYHFSNHLQTVLAQEGRRLYSTAAELIKRQSNREDIPFESIIEADALAFFMSLLDDESEWFPQTFYYSKHRQGIPLFIRATRHKDFNNLAKITGINDASLIQEKISEGSKRLRTESWNIYSLRGSLSSDFNLDKLDTIN